MNLKLLTPVSQKPLAIDGHMFSELSQILHCVDKMTNRPTLRSIIDDIHRSISSYNVDHPRQRVSQIGDIACIDNVTSLIQTHDYLYIS